MYKCVQMCTNVYSAVQDNGDNGHMSPNSRLLPSPVSSCTKATQRTHLATFKWLHRRSKLGPLKRARLSTAESTVWTEGIVCQIARSGSDFHNFSQHLSETCSVQMVPASGVPSFALPRAPRAFPSFCSSRITWSSLRPGQEQ